MTALILVDTNVILYSLDQAAKAKQARCAAWLKALTQGGLMVVSPQVCSETRVNAERKLKLPAPFARQALEVLLPLCTAPLGAAEVRAALEIEARWKTSWWDALLIASAKGAGCSHLLTEDRQSAPVIADVHILDPFSIAPAEWLSSA